jgi:hypothetical protein
MHVNFKAWISRDMLSIHITGGLLALWIRIQILLETFINPSDGPILYARDHTAPRNIIHALLFLSHERVYSSGDNNIRLLSSAPRQWGRGLCHKLISAPAYPASRTHPRIHYQVPKALLITGVFVISNKKKGLGSIVHSSHCYIIETLLGLQEPSSLTDFFFLWRFRCSQKLT